MTELTTRNLQTLGLFLYQANTQTVDASLGTLPASIADFPLLRKIGPNMTSQIQVNSKLIISQRCE